MGYHYWPTWFCLFFYSAGSRTEQPTTTWPIFLSRSLQCLYCVPIVRYISLIVLGKKISFCAAEINPCVSNQFPATTDELFSYLHQLSQLIRGIANAMGSLATFSAFPSDFLLWFLSLNMPYNRLEFGITSLQSGHNHICFNFFFLRIKLILLLTLLQWFLTISAWYFLPKANF